MIADKTFLRYIVVKIADEYQAGSHNFWRITLYNGTAQDNTQLCYTNFLRYKYSNLFAENTNLFLIFVPLHFHKNHLFFQGETGKEAHLPSGKERKSLVNAITILLTVKNFQVVYQ